MAREVVMLAKALINRFGDTPIVLASLVRAGVPLGVMLHHTLRALGKTSFHYGISIIRDRGIDEVALSYIEQKHGTEGLVFVDGWTGKGAITGELTAVLGYLQPMMIGLSPSVLWARQSRGWSPVPSGRKKGYTVVFTVSICRSLSAANCW